MHTYKYWPAWLGLRWGTFGCVGWQVILCDSIWQVTLHSSVMCSHKELYTTLPFMQQLHGVSKQRPRYYRL